MVNKLRSKKGGTTIVIVLMMAILFPVIMSGIIDLTNIYKIEKRMKTSLNAAVKSASTRIDWSQVPQGIFDIDTTKGRSVYVDIFNKNMNINLVQNGNYYSYTSPTTGNKITTYVDFYNDRHTGTFVDFPNAGTIPGAVTGYNITVPVDRPTAFGVATAQYKLSPVFGGKVINLTKYASSELNYIPQMRQASANLLNASWNSFQYLGNPSLFTILSSGGHGNESYMNITGTGYGDSGAMIYVSNLKPNTTYKYSAWVKIPYAGTSFGNGLLFIVNKSNSAGLGAVNLPSTAATDWTYVTGTFNTGVNDAVWYRIDRGDFSQILVSDVYIYPQ